MGPVFIDCQRLTVHRDVILLIPLLKRGGGSEEVNLCLRCYHKILDISTISLHSVFQPILYKALVPKKNLFHCFNYVLQPRVRERLAELLTCYGQKRLPKSPSVSTDVSFRGHLTTSCHGMFPNCYCISNSKTIQCSESEYSTGKIMLVHVTLANIYLKSSQTV